MNARSLFLTAILLAIGSGGIFEARVIRRQRDELQTLQKGAADSNRQLAALHRESDAARHDLNVAEQQLTAPPAPATADAAMVARETETKAWLARVKQLKRLFDERPGQNIPEMQWLTDEDWLRVAKRASFDDEHQTRKALGDLRSRAKTRFSHLLNPALRSFARTANGGVPPSILALASHFEKPIDAAILERYEIIKDGASGNIGQGVLTVREKTPVDEDYDSRPHMSSNGTNSSGGSTNAPYAWIPDFRERTERAYRNYAQANNGASPAGIAQALPFFNPPLEPAKIELFLRFERERSP